MAICIFNVPGRTMKRERLALAGVPLLTSLNWEQEASVRVGDETSELIEIKQGARQGCLLSPDLFSLYTQLNMLELKELERIKTGGNNINNIKYANDMILMEEFEEKLQELVSKLDKWRRMGLMISLGKTEAAGVTKANGRLPVSIRIAREATK